MRALVVLVVWSTALLSATTPSGIGGHDPAQETTLSVRPVPGIVLRTFKAPPGPYGPGHRGIDLAVAPGAPVRAASTGDVTFSGPVAGVAAVTVRTRDRLVTISGLGGVRVRAGERVAAGDVVGTAPCRPGDHLPGASAVHLSVRLEARGAHTYVDPGRLLPPRRARLTTASSSVGKAAEGHGVCGSRSEDGGPIVDVFGAGVPAIVTGITHAHPIHHGR